MSRLIVKGIFGDTWFISPLSYVNKEITNVGERFGSPKTMFGRCTNNPPAPTTYHPELDNTTFLGTDETQLYQIYVGILR